MMRHKRGRNEPCWCGARYPDGRPKKFKDCHLDRDKQTAPNFGDMLAGLKSAFGKQYCLYADAGPSCSGDIIKAHTIQRNGGLSRIARQGHVYTFDSDEATPLKTGQLRPGLIGIKKASTFTGFCGKHDATTFAPVELHPFRGTEEQIFLLAYRALCRELFYKRGGLEHAHELRNMDRGASPAHQMLLQMLMSDREKGIRAGLKELEHFKTLFDVSLMKRDFGAMRYYMIETDVTPDIVTSGMFQPESDFQGKRLQSLARLTLLDHITLNIVPTDTGGVVLLSWIGDLTACKCLAQSLDSLPDDAVPDAVLRLAIEHLENTFMSPNWWDSLPANVQTDLVKRARSGIGPGAGRRTDTALMDDGVRIASWKVKSRASKLQ